MNSVVIQSHELLLKYINEKSITIDCTCGNGQDTLLLAKNSKKVYAFDIQENAIFNTQKLLKDNHLNNVEVIHDGHENISNYVHDEIDAAIFNLGYLPKGDKSITTNFHTTKEAIDQLVHILSRNGIIVIVVYIGHSEGAIESDELLSYLSGFSLKDYFVDKIQSINHVTAPYIITIKKR